MQYAFVPPIILHSKTWLCSRNYVILVQLFRCLKTNENHSLFQITIRGIALSSIFGKALDRIILDWNADVFNTSDMEFGFKPKHSTKQCTFAMQEVVNYYRDAGADIYAMFLDASNAFDRVNYLKLFTVLL